ncbi:MAG: hypothetical protein OXG68_07095 [Chloroflexi bacterium]|nr:hypothetical protein [Chloroflexota bacterium]
MTDRRVDLLWRILLVATVEVLNPLLLITLALFASLGYVLTLLMPVSIHHWQRLFWLSLIISLLRLILRAYRLWRAGEYTKVQFSWRSPLPLLPLLIFLPVFRLELAVPYAQIIWHGDMHVAYIHQIMHAATPVDSIFLPGYPANFYWLYHAFVAAVAQVTSLAPPLAASLLNMAAILSSLLWIALMLIRLRIASVRTIYLGLLAVLVFCAVNLSGPLTVSEQLLSASDEYIHARDMVLESGDVRLHSVLGKVMNFTSFPLALLSFVAALHVCIRIVQDDPDRFALALLSACVIVGLAVQPIVVLYILISLFGGLTVTGYGIWLGSPDRWSVLRSYLRRVARKLGTGFLLVWLLLSVGLSLPLVKYVTDFATASGAPIQFGSAVNENLGMIVAALILLLPLFLLQAAFVMRRPRRAELFIQISAVVGFLLTASLVFPDINQYKGVFFAAILFALSALFALRSLRTSRRRFSRAIAQVILAALLILVAVKVVIVTRYYEYHADEGSFAYDGIHINYGDRTVSTDLGEALQWIRSHTPGDSLVVLPISINNYAHLIHERQLYVRRAQDFFVDGSAAAYKRRAQQVSRLYSYETGEDEYREVLEEMTSELPSRGFYAVVRVDEVSPETMLARGAALVYSSPGDGANVYLLNPNVLP